MSCGGNRHKFFQHQIQANGGSNSLMAAFKGNAQAAIEALERTYQVFKSAAVRQKPGEAARLEATAKTRKLFDEMRAAKLKPPTHAKDGMPKASSRFGYAAVQDTLDAIEGGKPLPKDAQAVVDQVKAKHGLGNSGTPQISAVGFDDGGYYRCGNCGRFASQSNGHTCPSTASSEDLSAMLQRRLKLPASAFQGYGNQALDQLIEEARESGSTRMIHPLTGEPVDVTLDGIPQAMMQGFVPEGWAGKTSTVLVDGDRLIPVLDAKGLEAVTGNDATVLAVAVAHGLQLDPNAPIMRATATSNALLNTTKQGDQVALSEGRRYDLGHFVGTEFRKNSARGTSVTIRGQDYPIYSRSKDPKDASSARGQFAPDAKSITVGRTLPDAIRILDEGSIAESGNGDVLVYDKNGQLLAAYNEKEQRAADVHGSTNASSEQMAAIVASRMLHPQNAFDYALIQDYADFQSGQGSPLAAADSAYLSVRTGLLAPGDDGTKGTISLGGKLTAQKCPQCGQFVGQNGHNCPGKAPEKAQKPAAARKAPVVTVPEAPMAAPDSSQTEVPAPVQVVMPDNFADKLAAAVGSMLKGQSAAPSTTPAPVADPGIGAAMKELTNILAAQQQTLERLAQAPAKGAGGFSSGDMQGLSAAITSAVAAANNGAPVQQAVAAKGPEKCDQCGQFKGDDHVCPPRPERLGNRRPADMPELEQEKALAGVTLPAPDLYLENVPREWGGKRFDPLDENVPSLSQEYEMGRQEKAIFNVVGAMLKRSEKGNPGDSPWNRSFGLYGPAGTGKNTIARQIAASLKTDDGKQGVPYYEVNVTPDLDIAQAIGEVVLTTDPDSGSTVSQVRLGPIGLLASSGGVLAVNEIVRSPKLATALQSIIEDGELSIPSPEGGSVKIPVHPSAMFFSTWNPGYEGDADRPAQAPLSRMTSFKLDYPSKKEQRDRVRSFFRKNGDTPPDEKIISDGVDYWNELRVLTGGTGQEPQIGMISPTPTTPGPRELSRFLTIGQTAGWENAMRTVEIICDQSDDLFPTQRAMLHERFEAIFGTTL